MDRIIVKYTRNVVSMDLIDVIGQCQVRRGQNSRRAKKKTKNKRTPKNQFNDGSKRQKKLVESFQYIPVVAYEWH
jgi:hypothetical protein